MPKRHQHRDRHDRSPGDQRARYSDRGGPAARHAETHDVRREQLTNPKGLPPSDEEFDRDIAPDTSANELGGHMDESIRAVADKTLHERLDMLGTDDLARIPVLAPGTRLEQGGTYIDLNHLDRGSFKAMAGQEAGPGDRYVAKRDLDYELWNQLAGEDREPAIVRPAREEHGIANERDQT